MDNIGEGNVGIEEFKKRILAYKDNAKQIAEIEKELKEVSVLIASLKDKTKEREILQKINK